MTAYETALAGGKHSGFLKNCLGRSADEINKAIRSAKLVA
jgi:predicted GNAT superfamily acetyltransferase